MLQDKSITRYLPLAVIVVAAAAALLLANWQVVFGLFNPGQAIERFQQRDMSQLASRDTPLTLVEARKLLDTYARNTNSRADIALLGQDQKHGLPQEFMDELEAQFVTSNETYSAAENILTRMAVYRPLGQQIEARFRSLAIETKGYGRATTTLGEIGKHRPLTDESLQTLLTLADTQETSGSVALQALATTAAVQSLPDWALDELERIAKVRRATVRSNAIKVIATAGATDRAVALINAESASRPHPDAIAATLTSATLAELVRTLKDETLAVELRVGALDAIVKRRDESELVGDALSYAFRSDGPVLVKAYSTYSSFGRHHRKHIDVDWRTLSAAHFDGDKTLRHNVSNAFGFIWFEGRDEFLREMIQGTPRQQYTALVALGSLSDAQPDMVARVDALRASPDPEVAAVAGQLIDRITPQSMGSKIEEAIAATLFWVSLAIPIVGALAWQVWFTAKFLQRLGSGVGRATSGVISVVWLCVCIGVGALLFIGLLAMGHGGSIDSTIYALLVGLGAIVIALGWILNLFMRRIPAA